jgi:hypothetical protein
MDALLPITQIISARRENRKIDITFLWTSGFARDVLEIRVDNGFLVTTVKEVSPRVPFLGYLKFFT